MEERLQARQAEVQLRGEKVGILSKISAKNFIFQYNELYTNKKNAIPIATSFPLEHKVFQQEYLHPFFDNLIMEGWLLNQTEKKYHIDKKNRWVLLMLVGAHPIGAVTVHALNDKNELIIDEQGQDEGEDTTNYLIGHPKIEGYCSFCLQQIVSPQRFHVQCFKNLWGRTKSFYARLDKNQPLQSFSKTIYNGSISGAQRKGLFAIHENELQVDSINSMFILKPDGDFPELPANEHLTMTVARHLKFDVPETGIIEIDKVGLIFVIKRFDLISSDKLMIEDMAQIYQEVSDNKYSLSHEKVGQAILKHTQAGPLNLQDFFRRIIFCFLTANGDMHLKNWALLEMQKMPGTYRLCPVYDWVNTRIALSQEKEELAIPLLGKTNKMQKSYFKKFAVDNLKLTEEYVEMVFAEVPEWVRVINDFIPRSFLSPDMQNAYHETVEARFKVLGF